MKYDENGNLCINIAVDSSGSGDDSGGSSGDVEVSGTVAISSLPALSTGAALIGQVTINNNVNILAPSGIVTSSGDNILLAAIVGHSIVLTALTLQLESGAGPVTVLTRNYVTGSPPSISVTKRFVFNVSNDGVVYQWSAGFQLSLGVNNPLVINLSTAVQIGYSIEYYVL